jgi:type I site-specific restriction endonuclease
MKSGVAKRILFLVDRRALASVQFGAVNARLCYADAAIPN